MTDEQTSADNKISSCKLLPIEEYLLQLISIIYEPVSINFLASCIAKADTSFPDGHRPGTDEINATLSRLRELKLINSQNQCVPAIVEKVTRRSLETGLFPTLSALVQRKAPVSYLYGKLPTRCWRAMRQFRIGVYTADFDKIDEANTFLKDNCFEHFDKKPAPVIMVTESFQAKWFSTLPGSLQFFMLDKILRYSIDYLQHYSLVLDYLRDENQMTVSEDELVPFRRMLAGYFLLQGNFDTLRKLLEDHGDSFLGSGFAGSLAFLTGNSDQAITIFEEDIAQLRKFFGSDDIFFFGMTGLFCILALLSRNQEGDREAIRRYIAIALFRFQGSSEETAYRFIDAVVRSTDGDLPDMMILTKQLMSDERSLSTLLAVLSLHWLGVEIPENFQNSLIYLYSQGRKNNFLWLAMESAQLLGALNDQNEEYSAAAAKMRSKLGCQSIVNIVIPEDTWKQSLQDLISISSRTREPERTTRIIWLVNYQDRTLNISPREQKKKSSGGWSKGRSISLNRLLEFEELPFLTNQDRKICAAIQIDETSLSKTNNCIFDLETAAVALIGHPLVFLENSPSIPVELVAGEPELMVEKQGDHLFIHFTQDIGEGKVAVWQETPTRFRIIQIEEDHLRVAGITGRKGIRIPMAASRQVLDAIGNIASFMTVHSAIDVQLQNQETTIVDADPTIHIHMIPYGSGFRLEMFVQPFSRRGPYLKPGVGVANLMAEVDGHRLQTKRDLHLEEQRARETEENCPILDLAIDMEQENDREWHLLDPEECLQALLELEEIRDSVILEWPEGEKIAVRRKAGVNQLNLNIRTSQQDWFGLSGNIKIDEDEVIDLKVLLEKLKKSRSRFIPMGDGQFLALTQEFRNRLEELITYGNTATANDEILVHPLAAIALEDLTQHAKTTADDGWQQQLKSIQFAQDMVPEVPSTLQAELRDYQAEGFIWMCRLAHLGIGGCLADDMGLGKTLQAIAVILYLCKDKPSLVIAPTSVCMNWEMEIAKFAPTLTVRSLNEPDRDKTIRNLGKFDLLITSYTLLQQEIDLLSEVKWQTIVLDEAQAIKNAATKRSRAAMKLNSGFRLITTGTPIENHLGELWNLFRFINPGLLGSFKQFNTSYGIPIEKHHDRPARLKLKKLIRPFMLRRIKSQVLDELPPRTEITLRVEMEPSEMEFYEAIRQQAIENIEGNSGKSGHHLQILAEIMKLRRACCNPKLIVEDTDIPSTKLKVFAEVVDELLANRHKALVFSQFTAHLALIREFLDKKKINYKYLDGTTPAKERQRQVEAFQAGDGDLFLISLKAGGLGLNLTAADYVLHMDPWWNPAVEDQAADRAHRIGQKRPVTVYRLVAVNTIEEKIVRLHQEKRDLANSLLEGSDVSARISADELLQLIKES
jgi:SNF2 family DNA or RNA helicase